MLQRVAFAVLLFVSFPFAFAQAPSAPGKPLPPGPMQAKIKATCTQCHNATRITEQHLSHNDWSKELEKMEGLGASIPEEDRSAILAYLTKNFGPQKGVTKTPAKKSSAGTN